MHSQQNTEQLQAIVTQAELKPSLRPSSLEPSEASRASSIPQKIIDVVFPVGNLSNKVCEATDTTALEEAGSSPLNAAWKRAALLRIAAIKQREETPKPRHNENQPEPNQDRRQEPKQTRQYVSSCVQIIRAGSYLATSAAVERPALLEIASSTRLWLVFFIWSSV